MSCYLAKQTKEFIENMNARDMLIKVLVRENVH
jgi:hypothetical protein